MLRAADAAGVPAIVLCGRATVHPPGLEVRSLVDRFGERDAMERTAACLEELGLKKRVHDFGGECVRKVRTK